MRGVMEEEVEVLDVLRDSTGIGRVVPPSTRQRGGSKKAIVLIPIWWVIFSETTATERHAFPKWNYSSI